MAEVKVEGACEGQSAHLDTVTLLCGLHAVEAGHDDADEAFIEGLIAGLQMRLLFSYSEKEVSP